MAEDKGLQQDRGPAVSHGGQLPARQFATHARPDERRVRDAYPSANRRFFDADREQRGALAGALVAAGGGRDLAHSAADIRFAGAIRIRAKYKDQSVALPGRAPSARQAKSRALAHV